MANSSQALFTKLLSLGYPVYQDKPKNPENTPANFIVYQKIAETDFAAHGARALLTRSRFQIRHVADSETNRDTMVSAVRNALVGNNTDFNAAMASDVHIQAMEAVGIHSAVKDYYIWFKE